ncbi:MBL fold metallo-hydrolase [Peristeroidobacter agariperforans]|uniref:MBL fold metallo-hydrolase n=1 Tax=Peristeroidobacter agariperforans TaxID=268404 RepID=UPI00101DE6D0|nr:MBL fold metallo-hydrolase [Peristeroidobacter agariperforans]
MNLGFETCGNATLIVYDRGIPVLVTDPWIEGAQYFGSWVLPYRFTEQQLAAFASTTHVWVSHGHPDHLNLESLAAFRNKTLLIPRHQGGRILRDLGEAGYRAHELEDNRWLQISPQVSILCFADWNQDAALLIALGEDCLVINLNDSSALGTRAKLLAQAKPFKRRFVFNLFSYGTADMINFFTEEGHRIEPLQGEKKPLGYAYTALLKSWQGTHTAPFSCHHVFGRTDSRWAANYETPIEAHGECFKRDRGTFIPGYFSYDVGADRITETSMEPVPRVFREPAEFGDDWSEPLDRDDIAAVRAYFQKFEHLRRKFQFIKVRVGGQEHCVDLGGPKGRGITFEAPRHSFMTAIQYEIFDDLLIGNFMKTVLHGGVRKLYPDFTPYVAKYGDNGRAFSISELDAYFRGYRNASGFQGWLDQVRISSSRKLRRQVLTAFNSASPALYRIARQGYRRFLA